MRRLRGVGARLSVALAAVVALSLAMVYLIVVPSLERGLIDAKLSQLERAAPGLRHQLQDNPYDPDFIDNAAASASARVVLFQPYSHSTTPALRVIGDSRGGALSSDIEGDPIALRSAFTTQTATGTVTRAGVEYAEVAVPVAQDGTTLLLSASLRSSLGDVQQVRRRLLVAGGIALAVAVLLGYLGARAFARRIRRLERAADRIASGQFDEPVADRGADELGELAGAFERMREQLAGLDRARRDFIANASHELRTPIFALGGFLELLVDEDLDEPTRREFLDTAREQVTRLTKLATELLDLSRLDAGRIELAREPVALAQVARAVVDEFAAVARASDHELTLAEGDHELALADEERTLQIARALVDNAIVHTPVGTRIRVRTAARDGATATLEVEDEGPGISGEDAPRVFERFFRAADAAPAGSGLGLAIARELAERMEGTIELESRPGRTRFTLVLPGAAPAPTRFHVETAVPAG